MFFDSKQDDVEPLQDYSTAVKDDFYERLLRTDVVAKPSLTKRILLNVRKGRRGRPAVDDRGERENALQKAGFSYNQIALRLNREDGTSLKGETVRKHLSSWKRRHPERI